MHTDAPGHVVCRVAPDGIANELGIVPGDTLYGISGQRVLDVIDYIALSAEDELTLLIQKRDGEWVEYAIQKDPDETLGLEFDTDLMDRRRTCCNNCVFCFISQMPPGMRKALYVKDDDWRLSMMMGNYVTLTNVPEQTLKRMIDRRVSPLYISVHATRDDVRARMMQNPKASGIMPKLERLASSGCVMHGQIVLCPGYNDAEVLSETLSTLYTLHPAMRSVAVVPVGLTRFRVGLPDIKPVDRQGALDILSRVNAVQKHALKQHGTRFAFASDEIYLLAGQPVPVRAEYEDFPQIENGVGLVRQLTDGFYSALDAAGKCAARYSPSIATGTLAAPVLTHLMDDYAKNSGINVPVYAVPNRYFGQSITVSGLVTGQDLIYALSGQPLGDALLIPGSMLNEQGNVFLDDYSIKDVSEALGVRVIPVPAQGDALLGALLGK